MPTTLPTHTAEADKGWFTRERLLTLTLALATFLLLYLCYLIALPFLTPLAWATALAVIAHPVHTRIAAHIRSPSLSAGLTCLIVLVVIIVPVVLVTQQVAQEVSSGLKHFQDEGPGWRARVAQNPKAAAIVAWVEQRVNIQQEMRNLGERASSLVAGVVKGSFWAGAQLLITIFILFYFFRDRWPVLGMIRSIAPLSDREASEVFSRLGDTIYATIYGGVTTALIQGTLGGLMFWVLGLPAPLLWGFVMFLLSIVPMLGSFLVWLPAAAILASQGEWVKAVILAAWGAIAIGLIDNILYPMLVGKRLHLHPLPIFFSIVGGISVFGAAGLVLGPSVLALSMAVVDIWRRRTAGGKPAEEAV